MPSNYFDKDIKGVPQLKGVNEGFKPLFRALKLSNSDTESGTNAARKNVFGHQ